MRRRSRLGAEAAIGCIVMAFVTSLFSPASVHAQAGIPTDEAGRLIARIAASSEGAAGGGFSLEDAPDPRAPATVLQAVLEQMKQLGRGSLDHGMFFLARFHVARARRHFTTALEQFSDTSPRLERVLASIRAGLAELDEVDRPRSRPLHAKLAELSSRVTAVARRIASGIVDVAESGGADRAVVAQARAALASGDLAVRMGNLVLAVQFYGQSLGFAANVITFDIDTFEQNIRNALAGQTVGYSYAIVRNGLLHASGSDGQARTSADEPETPQSPTKEMYVASMTKTISAVALLKLLHDHGISVEQSISSYLPPDWVQGLNLEDVTFRRLLTHRSGLDAAGVSCCSAAGQTLQSLQDIVAAGSTGASDNIPSNYTNANFSLLRVLIPQIANGEDVIASYANVYPLDAVYAGLYAFYVSQNVFEPAGIEATTCISDEGPDTRTLLYLLGSPAEGLDPGDWSLSSGATGWYLSSVELARLIAFLRFTDDVIDPGTRELMDDLFLGWLDPVAFAGYVSGAFGVYRAHGGDYPGGNVNGMTGCMMNFPIIVQVSLLINSRGGNLGGHACTLLKNAFDAAWVSP